MQYKNLYLAWLYSVIKANFEELTDKYISIDYYITIKLKLQELLQCDDVNRGPPGKISRSHSPKHIGVITAIIVQSFKPVYFNLNFLEHHVREAMFSENNNWNSKIQNVG